ncbi:probable L-type lectin-domain containing receptor kinase VII.2 [Neltuma alba]|uniref:probable L-type lectin-domain containing receptor kinase VII.2 n=1 Tax=Neltuma alba TaxID=207710 RepID=UPI0010A2C66B|nr:probable L-type lectin-domain containing receptor kinase VII.2 [Prosopis alba]
MASRSCFFLLLPLLLLITTLLSSVSSTEFVYNRDFNSTNIVLSGNATIQNSVLTLTNQTFFSIGRAFYPYKVPMKSPNSSTPLPFATSFIFSVATCKGLPTAHGFAFVLSPVVGISRATSGNYLGLFNRTNDGDPSNHIFGIEFDDFRNEDFNDINDNHVGVDLNSLISLYSQRAGFWDGDQFEELKLDSGDNYQVWIEFLDLKLNVTMAPAGKQKPQKPLISKPVNLSDVLLNEMYIGFSGATGRMVDMSRILAWSFSNSNFSIGNALLTRHLPSYVHPKELMVRSKWFIVGVILGPLLVIFCCTFVFLSFSKTRRKGKGDEEKNIEDWEVEYWPHRISYQDIHDATGGFSEENVIGSGTSGTVYKGVLQGVPVAVKRIHHDTQYGMTEFLAEISSLGRMKHRNLVGFRGWCKRKRGNLILVYDYMENGSLDKRIFECEDSMLLSWEQRRSVLQNVACGILYLHEGWEVEVLHRDIKAGNVLLDKDMNARLGDFGLARLHHQEQLADTTRVIGTLGYMAPELVKIGRPSKATDVYSFGILVLEVLCGRRPFVADKPALIDWVRSLMERDNLCSALDERLKAQGGFTTGEVQRLLHLGLICSSLEPAVRPTMRQVVKALEKISDAECDEECFGGNLLEKINSAAMWSVHSSNSTERSYPTFEEIMHSKYYTTTTISGPYYSLPPSEAAYVSEGR